MPQMTDRGVVESLAGRQPLDRRPSHSQILFSRDRFSEQPVAQSALSDRATVLRRMRDRFASCEPIGALCPALCGCDRPYVRSDRGVGTVARRIGLITTWCRHA
jgi:hypothetical protein